MTTPPREETQGRPEPGGEEAGQSPGSGGGRFLLRAALVLLALFAVAQGAGVLLRDRVEGRRTAGLAPPLQTPTGPEAAQPRAEPPVGARFGPEVREVTIAAAPTEILPEPPAPTAPPAPSEPAPTEPEPEKASTETSRPAPDETAPLPPTLPEAPVPAEVPAKERAGPRKPEREAEAAPDDPATTHVLQVGAFRSHRYRRQAELRLEALAVPHYRVEGTARSPSFRVTVSVPDAPAQSRAKEVLENAGYVYRASGSALEARFALEEEARRALDLLSQAALPAEIERTEEEAPLWTVFAGPFREADARAARELLAREGLESVLRRRP